MNSQEHNQNGSADDLPQRCLLDKVIPESPMMPPMPPIPPPVPTYESKPLPTLPPPCFMSSPPLPSREDTSEDPGTNNADAEDQCHFDDIHRLVYKLKEWNSFGDRENIIAISRPVKSVLQNGPKCGLVALSMASSICSSVPVTVSEFLSLAREEGFTKLGEMFSVDFMLQLANIAMPDCRLRIVEQKQLADVSFVVERIARGDIFLVPYDSDRNFAPACLHGHKAHWAIVTGVLIPVSELPGTHTLPNLLCLQPCDTSATVAMSALQDTSQVHVLARQGKSRHLSAWSLDQLIRSNGNLTQVDPSKDNDQFVVPEGGIEYGLCGKALLIQASSQ